jgi:hypothetical protein
VPVVGKSPGEAAEPFGRLSHPLTGDGATFPLHILRQIADIMGMTSPDLAALMLGLLISVLIPKPTLVVCWRRVTRWFDR